MSHKSQIVKNKNKKKSLNQLHVLKTTQNYKPFHLEQYDDTMEQYDTNTNPSSRPGPSTACGTKKAKEVSIYLFIHDILDGFIFPY